MPRVLIVGSANVDFTIALPRLPRPGETVSEGTLLVARGGTGANQAVAARRLGAEVRLLACVGDDASGREVRAALAAEGIGTDAVLTTSAAATGTALIVVDAEGRNQIAVAPGANRALTLADVEARDADVAWAEVVVASLEVRPAVAARALALARGHGALTVLNPAPFPDAGVDFLALADYVTPNETEAGRLAGLPVSGAEGAAAVAAAIRAGGAANVVLTLGAAGALADGRDGRCHAPAFAVTAVDTTGAGDAFNGALAVALAERRPLPAALRFANAAAALACTKRGAQPSMPTRAEVERLQAG
ncbi:MAG TPA: ribokinase [Methylomirabilota bacterium]|nr:ribokinase [Methylomirabilota bacterium]